MACMVSCTMDSDCFSNMNCILQISGNFSCVDVVCCLVVSELLSDDLNFTSGFSGGGGCQSVL